MNELHSTYPKTKQRIRREFLQLLQEKSFKEISVPGIMEGLELVRQTFYLHYRDKDDLLEEIISDLAGGLTELMSKAYENGIDAFFSKMVEGNHPIFIEYYKYMREYSTVFQLLIPEKNGTDFRRRFSKYMDEYREVRIKNWDTLNKDSSGTDKKQAGEADRKMLYNLYRSSIDNLLLNLFDWVMDGMEPSEEAMGAHHARMWISYIMLHGTEDDVVRETLLQKLKEKETP